MIKFEGIDNIRNLVLNNYTLYNETRHLQHRKPHTALVYLYIILASQSLLIRLCATHSNRNSSQKSTVITGSIGNYRSTNVIRSKFNLCRKNAIFFWK